MLELRPQGAHEKLAAMYVRGMTSEPDEGLRRSLRVGLTSMRLVIAWLEGEAPSDWGIARVRTEIGRLPECPERLALDELLRTFAADHSGMPESVALALYRYGRALEYEGRQPIAIAVFGIAIRTVTGQRHVLALRSAYRIGQSLIALGRARAAKRVFERLGRASIRWSSNEGIAWAELGRAELAWHRGNFPEATARNRRVLRAARSGILPVKSRALGSISALAIKAGDYERAIRLGYEGLLCCDDEAMRDRILLNLAGAFLVLDAHQVARSAYAYLAAKAKERYVRAAAAINLLQLAVDAADRHEFNRLGETLAFAPLPPDLRVQLLLTRGEGLRKFGDRELGTQLIRDSLAVAVEHGVNEHALAAEKLLAASGGPARPSPSDRESIARFATATAQLVAALDSSIAQ